MSMLRWVGLGPKPQSSRPYIEKYMRERIGTALHRIAGPPITTARDEYGVECQRYMIDGIIITAIIDQKTRTYIGVGIEYVNDEDAAEKTELAHYFLWKKLEIIHYFEDVEIWEWDPSAEPALPPVSI